MTTFTKEDLYLLNPCEPYPTRIFEADVDEPFNGAVIVDFINSFDPKMIPWIVAGSVNLAIELIEEQSIDVNLRGHSNRTALHFAAIYRRPDVIAYLLTKGASKLLVDIDGKTPVQLANESEDPATIAAMEG